jgi:geranylgeranyl diphosphate synthase type II
MDIKTYLKEKRELIDSYLKSYFSVTRKPSVLHEAMSYSLFAGGKRIRPILALASYEACGGDPKDIIPFASALELIHTYSLIHDDLPAMDDDELRRGKPTSHKVFGEAMAILAGDALLTEAFYMLSSMEVQSSKFKVQSLEDIGQPVQPLTFNLQPSTKDFESQSASGGPNPEQILKIVREVAMAAGASGMVGGQAQDILSENSEPDKDTLHFIHLHKTAALITASVRMGPMLAGSDEGTINALTRYGENIGLVFQIIDDILDIEGDPKELGKSAGLDKRKMKMTYPSLLGVEGSRQKAQDLISEAINALRIFSSEADPLREIALYLIKRRF